MWYARFSKNNLCLYTGFTTSIEKRKQILCLHLIFVHYNQKKNLYGSKLNAFYNKPTKCLMVTKVQSQIHDDCSGSLEFPNFHFNPSILPLAWKAVIFRQIEWFVGVLTNLWSNNWGLRSS
ncbi:hypothetical protein HanXRQr2_Chr13g0599481 [Helianthus annuus]|uniref:Uncharacterized protein n=1 Tax=Helianthus annuus TaxID=4232 RepID=A0A9K3EJC5_HELAN|nr:hypothetical protein HanXRQr2_Chr13g0599481 [Helianthus annuus]KAJ0850179.1 hypothetical protein HanPSC8_Chr13g0577581 [Helianthus annuus]